MLPVLIINPADDGDFGRYADECLDQGADSPARLEGSLRAHYPRAVVRARELSSELNIVWYVYRDGFWIPPSGRGDA
jgi:hypothetical protein